MDEMDEIGMDNDQEPVHSIKIEKGQYKDFFEKNKSDFDCPDSWDFDDPTDEEEMEQKKMEQQKQQQQQQQQPPSRTTMSQQEEDEEGQQLVMRQPYGTSDAEEEPITKRVKRSGSTKTVHKNRMLDDLDAPVPQRNRRQQKPAMPQQQQQQQQEIVELAEEEEDGADGNEFVIKELLVHRIGYNGFGAAPYNAILTAVVFINSFISNNPIISVIVAIIMGVLSATITGKSGKQVLKNIVIDTTLYSASSIVGIVASFLYKKYSGKKQQQQEEEEEDY